MFFFKIVFQKNVNNMFFWKSEKMYSRTLIYMMCNILTIDYGLHPVM